METDWENSQSRRLMKRLIRHQSDLFTFVDQPGVPFENNLAERAIRPAVIIRKNSYGNRSQPGADTQAILKSLFSMLKKRGHTPLETVQGALASYLKTGQLLPLPQKKSRQTAKVLRRNENLMSAKRPMSVSRRSC